MTLKQVLSYDFMPADIEIIYGTATGAKVFISGAQRCIRKAKRCGMGAEEEAAAAQALLDDLEKALDEIRSRVRAIAPGVSPDLAGRLDCLDAAVAGTDAA